ncbi:PucR family transcriptional regulator [Anaerotignum sp. MB30-C6]|uniref:PucR family transcriptional regulator n=1 Tax=Anaerotignum sp. MB30-C6 TaxID=3070814 RepID=UPI0027DBA016|nr:PucR family transcriptional regulator [Anaerotignum sp. MB30-C6]WMI80298.1 PucR family transcriptional regulator ligand-binding domain-containing protein [Anaerotignum sp. MB30-C6]
MSIIVEKLLQKANVYHVTLVAGEKGLNRGVNWFHMVENMAFAAFIEEKNLVFTSGMALNEEMDLFTLVEAQIKQKASGTLLNLGPYIPQVPQKVIDLCNKNDYPLMVCPWNVRIPDIMKLFSNILLNVEKAEVELGSALRNAIYFPSRKNLYANTLYQYGFQENGFYTLGIIKPEFNATRLSPDKLEQMVQIIERILMSTGDKSFVINSEGEFILVFCNYKEDAIIKILNRIMTALLSRWDTFFLGIGSNLQSLDHISSSYKQAIKMMHFNKKQNKKNEFCLYRELGLYKLFFAIDNTDVLEEYYLDCLGALEEHDLKKNTNYIEVLTLYLEKNGSINETAEMLFLHRNTVNYKIRKIEEMLGCSLSQIETRSKLFIALCLKNIID